MRGTCDAVPADEQARPREAPIYVGRKIAYFWAKNGPNPSGKLHIFELLDHQKGRSSAYIAYFWPTSGKILRIFPVAELFLGHILLQRNLTENGILLYPFRVLYQFMLSQCYRTSWAKTLMKSIASILVISSSCVTRRLAKSWTKVTIANMDLSNMRHRFRSWLFAYYYRCSYVLLCHTLHFLTYIIDRPSMTTKVMTQPTTNSQRRLCSRAGEANMIYSRMLPLTIFSTT